MAKLYRISFLVDQTMAKVMTDLIIDRVRAFTCAQVDEDKARIRSHFQPEVTHQDPPWDGKAAKAIIEYMAKGTKGKVYHHSELAKVLPSVGLNERSISPILSLMCRRGRIVRAGKGQYKAPE